MNKKEEDEEIERIAEKRYAAGLICELKGDYGKASTYYHRACQLSPMNSKYSDSRFKLGLIFEEIGKK